MPVSAGVRPYTMALLAFEGPQGLVLKIPQEVGKVTLLSTDVNPN